MRRQTNVGLTEALKRKLYEIEERASDTANKLQKILMHMHSRDVAPNPRMASNQGPGRSAPQRGGEGAELFAGPPARQS